LPIGKAFSPFFLPLFYKYSSIGSSATLRFYGAGINILRGVSCIADVKPSNEVKLDFVFGMRQLNLPWLEEAISNILSISNCRGVNGVLDFSVESYLGFDISVGSAILLSSLVAVNSALKLNVAPSIIADLSQRFELEWNVGSGTSLCQLLGGVVLLSESGESNTILHKVFDFPSDLRIVVGGPKLNLLPIYTSRLIGNFTFNFDDLNSFDDLIEFSRIFNLHVAEKSKGAFKFIKALLNLNPLVAGLGFLGKSFYAITFRDDVKRIVDHFLDYFPCEGIFVSEVDPIGVRLYID